MIRWILVLWPSFVIAGIAEMLFFTLVNPRELYLFGHVVDYSPLATYSIGFFAFWAVCAASSLLTLYLYSVPGDRHRKDGAKPSLPIAPRRRQKSVPYAVGARPVPPPHAHG
ncbi:MAG TPA: hypothetical protein VKY38_06995 [Azoarcus sp.]|nr:hypothetical protein [Azoarcus sp.]